MIGDQEVHAPLVDGYGVDNLVRMVHGSGRFLGELGILAGRKTLLTPVAGGAGRTSPDRRIPWP